MTREPLDPNDALSRLLAARLQRPSPPADESGSVCPDAALLAAYVDGDLASDERAMWEAHIADCARCRQTLLVMMRASNALPSTIVGPTAVATPMSHEGTMAGGGDAVLGKDAQTRGASLSVATPSVGSSSTASQPTEPRPDAATSYPGRSAGSGIAPASAPSGLGVTRKSGVGLRTWLPLAACLVAGAGLWLMVRSQTPASPARTTQETQIAGGADTTAAPREVPRPPSTAAPSTATREGQAALPPAVASDTASADAVAGGAPSNSVPLSGVPLSSVPLSGARTNSEPASSGPAKGALARERADAGATVQDERQNALASRVAERETAEMKDAVSPLARPAERRAADAASASLQKPVEAAPPASMAAPVAPPAPATAAASPAAAPPAAAQGYAQAQPRPQAKAESTLAERSAPAAEPTARAKATPAPGAAAGAAAGGAPPAPARVAEPQAAGAAAGRTESASAEVPAALAKERANQLALAAKSAGAAALEVRAPADARLWRVQQGGVIMTSVDRGLTWQTEHVDRGARLLAGSAPSASICWFAGANGLVLRRTADGRWQRTGSTPAASDLRAIAATSETRATVTTMDDVVYLTEDGGRSWTQVSSPRP